MHTGGSGARYRAIRSTWFRLTAPDMALVAFGVRPRGLVETERERFVNAPPVDGDFAGTKWAFLYAAAEFPSAEFVSKFDDDCYVYTRHVAEALGLLRPRTSQARIATTNSEYLNIFSFFDTRIRSSF